jgi:hypothetical protein
LPLSAWIENASTMRHRAQPFGRLVKLAAGKAVIAARGRLADRAIDSDPTARQLAGSASKTRQTGRLLDRGNRCLEGNARLAGSLHLVPAAPAPVISEPWGMTNPPRGVLY